MALTLRRQREARGLSLRALAQRSGVSVYRLVDFEHSRRTPDPDQYSKLREVLALDDIPETDQPLTEMALTSIAACLAWTHGLPLATLTAMLGLSTSEVRDGIAEVSGRLRAIGLDVSVDHQRARVAPLSWCAGTVRVASEVSPLSQADVRILAILYERDGARVAELEDVFGSATRRALASLSDRGLVSCATQGQVARRRYWVTDHGLMCAADFALRTGTRLPSEPAPA